MSYSYGELQRFTREYVTDHPLVVDGLQLRLRRVGPTPRRGAKAAMLVHGANSGSVTFLVPNGGLARYLVERGWDVWLLDWRGSPFVVEPLLRAHPDPSPREIEEERRLFAFERAAADVREGLRFVRAEIGPDACLSVLGHCVGGGITSVAMALGGIDPSVENVALSALGLFFEVPWDGWVKAEDFVLERMLATEPGCRAIDPHARSPWPRDMETAFRRWPKAWFEEATSPEVSLLNRLSFMVGKPWSPPRIDPSIDHRILQDVFGSLHLGLYLHCGQNVRRGFSAYFGELDVLDRARLEAGPVEERVRDHLVPEGFRNRNITLLTTAQNRVWHRDAMDLMYDWLMAEARPTRVSKAVFPTHGLQELFWAKNAREETYPTIERALAGAA
jgi:pimeloyl-ACP methyl ester carboxylesterase